MEQCINAGLELTTDEEVTKIRRIVDEMVEGQLTQEDLRGAEFSKFALRWKRASLRIMPA